MAILDGRHKKAEELRRLTDQSASMSEDQLSELRADIKVNMQISVAPKLLTWFWERELWIKSNKKTIILLLIRI